jgi:hypothetical protein
MEVFVAEPEGASASCEDTNDNGVAGLTGAEFMLTDVRTGATILASVVPDGGEIDESGWHPVTIRINEMTLKGLARFESPTLHMSSAR